MRIIEVFVGLPVHLMICHNMPRVSMMQFYQLQASAVGQRQATSKAVIITECHYDKPLRVLIGCIANFVQCYFLCCRTHSDAIGF